MTYMPHLADLPAEEAAEQLGKPTQIREQNNFLVIPKRLWHDPPLFASDEKTNATWIVLPAYYSLYFNKLYESWHWVAINTETAKKETPTTYECQDFHKIEQDWLQECAIRDLKELETSHQTIGFSQPTDKATIIDLHDFSCIPDKIQDDKLPVFLLGYQLGRYTATAQAAAEKLESNTPADRLNQHLPPLIPTQADNAITSLLTHLANRLDAHTASKPAQT